MNKAAQHLHSLPHFLPLFSRVETKKVTRAMVTLATLIHHLIVLCVSISFCSTLVISSNVNATTVVSGRVNSSTVSQDNQVKSTSFINSTSVNEDKSIETQIEIDPGMAVGASNYEPSSVDMYDGSSKGYDDYNEKKQHEHASHHGSGEEDSHEKGWEKLKEKERRVKDRGSGFIKAFTWDREEISKDKYKDKGHEKDSHRDHSTNDEYERGKHGKQHSSKHSKGHRSKSIKAGNSHPGDLYQHDPGVGEVAELSALEYDPNALLYASQLAQAYPSSQTMYIPSYSNALSSRALMSRLLY